MNPYLETILSLLKSERGIVPRTSPATLEGSDGRLYVQVVGVRGFPVFAIGPKGGYHLPFEHSYNNQRMKEYGLPILGDRAEGLNAALFADYLAARTDNGHDLGPAPNGDNPPYDGKAIDRVRQMARDASPRDAWTIWYPPPESGIKSAA